MGENLALLLVTAFALMGSPGPATLSLAATGSAFGAAAGVRYLGGIILGTAAVLAVVASGVSGVVLALPGAAAVITTIAACYILLLAWRIATAEPVSRDPAQDRAPSFVGGLFLGVANPKAYAAIGAVYSSVRVVQGDVGADAAVKLAALLVVIVVVNGSWLLFGSAFAALLSAPRLARPINIVLAILLVLSVLGVVLL